MVHPDASKVYVLDSGASVNGASTALLPCLQEQELVVAYISVNLLARVNVIIASQSRNYFWLHWW